MSDYDEEEQTFRSGTSDEPPISALPPRVVAQEESQVEVSASPAFQCVDELFRDGKITGTKAALYKSKYAELHELLKSTRENEAFLLQNAKKYTTELEKCKAELDKADNFPENSNTEVSKLRQQLLKYNNDLAQAEERAYNYEVNIESLKEEKVLTEREYSRMPKQGEIERKIDELKTACSDLRKEISQRQLEVKTMKEENEKQTRQIQEDQKQRDTSRDTVISLKAELLTANNELATLTKEADRCHKQTNELEKSGREMDRELTDLREALRKLQKNQAGLQEEKFELDTEVDRSSGMVTDREREFQMLVKDFEYARDREAVLMGDRATLELNVRHVSDERQTLQEEISRRTREKDRELRALKKADLQLRVAQDGLEHTSGVHNKMQSMVDACPKDDGSMLKKRRELLREVDQIKGQLSGQNSLTAQETVRVEQSIAEEERLLYEQSDLRVEVVELQRLAAIKNDEREQKSRDFNRAETRHQRALQDLRQKQLEIQDKHKKFQEMQTRLKEFAKQYDVIKTERNKYVNQIQTSTQKSAEMRDKIKVLQNEIEIQRTSAVHKDRTLQKQRMKHVAALVVRDGLRGEVAKQRRLEETLRDQREQQRADISKLNALINQAEEEMVRLRKRYEAAVQQRNDRGLQLIERDEEVCVFYEKINIQDQMLRNGDVEMAAREEEIRFLKMAQAEEQRALGLLQRGVPSKRQLEQEIVTLQIQRLQCQERRLDLEGEMENPEDETRVRFLRGNDPSPAELQNKLEELELRLAEKEEGLLERELILEQDCRLCERSQKRVDAGKDDTLQLAKKVNELQVKIKEVTRKMMAMVSELSMHQATAMKLQQEVKEKELELEQCYMRLERGEAPSDDMEKEWMKRLRDQARKRQQKHAEELAASEQQQQHALPGGTVTTAELRPNAYLPDQQGELPIPRPYGAHQPFKPSEPGASMRHIRKPVPKPIEI